MQTLLADDNGEIRAALRLLLEELGERDIVEVADLKQASSMLEQSPAAVVLLDWELPVGGYPGGDSAGFVRECKQNMPDCRVIAMSCDPGVRRDSLRAGCDAFISRNDPPDTLVSLLGTWRGMSA